ncbi:PREDICTED: uncharacterized protein LOC109466018 [Branchiostoma belcheri]|uniref:Uncharacterized protein LOC109466018 n=1 Tax=Branchiostoma belcheri TaxID=7741 RepID=A0A6P4YPJ0_BRABE|nr:PREDICTED: uncharacterized protein LOC109466018 [Branchiostoma belcheri]
MAAQPLPPGWEAKYDAGTGRYFFIDHINKKTSWTDPRTTMQVPQPQPAAPRSPARSPRQENIQMTHVAKPKCKTCHIKEVQYPGWECWNCQQNRRSQQQQQQQQQQLREQEQDTSFTIDTAALNRLCHAYPAAKRDIISTTLELLMNDERETADTLEQMGYRKRGATPKASPTKTTPKKPSPKKTTTVPKPPAQPAHPPQLTEAQKNRVRSEVKALYPNMPHTVVQMALESADYDKEKVVQLLKFMQDDQQPAASTSSRSSHVTEPTAGPARTTSPARFDSSSGSQPVEFSSSLQAPVFGDDTAGHRAQRARSPKSGSRGPSVGKTAQKSPIKTMIGSSSSVQSRIKTSSKTTTRATTTARTKPSSAGYVSPLRNKPNGPDHSLLNGPNRELLMKDYVEQHGPNPEYVKGPALREGAKPHLAKGPNPELIQGPAHFN